MTREKIMERIDNRTLGPEFMKEFVRIDMSQALTTDERYDLTKRTVTNIDMQFSHLDPGRASSQNISTMVIRKHQVAVKNQGPNSSNPQAASSSTAANPNNRGNQQHQNNQKRQRTMVIQGGGPRNGKKSKPDSSSTSTTVCTHCYKQHHWGPEKCHMNKDVPKSQIPEIARERILMQRRYRYGPEYDWPSEKSTSK